MTQYFQVHPENPQQRLLNQAAELIRQGAVVVYPTDATYAVGCHLGDKNALERIRRLRRLDKRHQFTLVCRDLSELGLYAKVDNTSFRILKHYTPGPYTFLLPATKEVPRRLVHEKKRTIGLRVPANVVAAQLLETLGEPMMSTSLILPDDVGLLSDMDDIRNRLEGHVDLIIDGGPCELTPTTVVDLTGPAPEVVREGLGVFDV
jgi:tRNA threonylcarbamoyl adenosine modification protein (Sua5/YciO/YrdC/YwlC family)